MIPASRRFPETGAGRYPARVVGESPATWEAVVGANHPEVRWYRGSRPLFERSDTWTGVSRLPGGRLIWVL